MTPHSSQVRKDRGNIEHEQLGGTVYITDRKNVGVRVTVDQIAITEAGNGRGESNKLAYLSLVGTIHEIKAARSILTANSVFEVIPDKVIAKNKYNQTVVCPGSITEKLGYLNCYHRLGGYNEGHAIFASRAPGLLLDATDETLWRELRLSERYTTPLSRTWIPWLRSMMVAHELLTPCTNYNANCWMLKLSTPVLDRLVSTGIKAKHLRIEPDESNR